MKAICNLCFRDDNWNHKIRQYVLNKKSTLANSIYRKNLCLCDDCAEFSRVIKHKVFPDTLSIYFYQLIG